jgi:Mnd1 HTH domain
MSIDDKQKTVLNIYHERLEPFNLKEIETLGSRAGVVQQTIKDVNQMLIDDFLVYSDKIGAANIFWSFPSKTYKDRENTCSKIEAEMAGSSALCANLESDIEKARMNRSASDRSVHLEEYHKLLFESTELDKKLEEYRSNDPEEIKRVQAEAMMCRDASNRWVDNLGSIKKFLVKKKGLPSKEVIHLYIYLVY